MRQAGLRDMSKSDLLRVASAAVSEREQALSLLRARARRRYRELATIVALACASGVAAATVALW